MLRADVAQYFSARPDRIVQQQPLSVGDYLVMSDRKLPRIALVDDHPAVLDQTVNLLSQDFDIVLALDDGRDLLEVCGDLKLDAIVLDITLPGLSGIQLAARLKQMNSQAKIVFLTVHADPDYAREAFEVGAMAYVIKPRLASDLIPALMAVLVGKPFVSPCPELSDVD
jgi:DNA-binding NarL/FixJ family response regulator